MIKNIKKVISELNSTTIQSQRFIYLDKGKKEVFCLVEGGYNFTQHNFKDKNIVLIKTIGYGVKSTLKMTDLEKLCKKYV